MYVLGIVSASATTLCDRLATQSDNCVTTVESPPESAVGPGLTDGIAAAYRFSPNGNWVGPGDDRDLDGLLDDLSTEYDYAFLSRPSDARVPTVAPAGVDTVNVVVETETAGAADVASLAAETDSHEPHVTLETLVEHTKADPLEVHTGVIATLTRRVRAKESEDDDPTLNLEFEGYDGVVGSKMDAISEKLEARDGVLRVLTYHRVGVVEDGADIVFVVAPTGHRRGMFRAVEDGIDRLEDEAPTFKKETTTDEEFWIHGRQDGTDNSGDVNSPSEAKIE